MHSFEELKANCLQCTKCKLSATRTQVVFGQGPAPCNLMLIGEGPGREEDEQGIPFVGRSGQLLTKMLESAGLNRPYDVYIANIVKCRPPENRNPEKDEEEACLPWLKKQIELVNPKIIVLVGAVAMKALLGGDKAITKVRGQWTNYEGRKCMIILHPSYLLRYPSNDQGKPKWLTLQDIKEVKIVLDNLKSKEKVAAKV